MDIPLNNLLRIPEEVIYGYIFPHLNLNELLRLRRICKETKIYSDDYIRNHFKEQEREINETTFKFEDFIKCNFPTSHIYINNTGPDIYEDPKAAEFLSLYAHKINHLRVKYFQTCISEHENNFFLALTNLQHLDLEYTDAKGRRIGYDSQTINGVTIPREMCYYPPNFQNLKTLLLNEIVGSEIMDHNYAWDMYKFFTEVEHLRHPLYTNIIEGMSSYNSRHHDFGCIIDCIQKRLQTNPGQPLKLKYYDIQHHDERGFNYFAYLELLQLCFDNNIKLLNADADLNDMVDSVFRDNRRIYADPLVSVKNLHAALIMTELPNLEKVVIESTGDCSYLDDYINDDEPEWPKLHTLEINIDSEMTQGSREFPEVPVSELYAFLFGFVKRGALRDLKIGFDKGTESRRNALPCSRVADIVGSCENLTKLTLSNWLGTNKAISKFWSGLVHLEDVTLEECKMLGDVAFVGTNREDPTFLKLTKLRKFSLLGLDTMTKITDLVFNMVFRHLKIQKFYITSNHPIKSVTINGLRSLLTGEFNNYVEKFPFQDWSLDNVSSEELEKLKLELRASHML